MEILSHSGALNSLLDILITPFKAAGTPQRNRKDLRAGRAGDRGSRVGMARPLQSSSPIRSSASHGPALDWACQESIPDHQGAHGTLLFLLNYELLMHSGGRQTLSSIVYPLMSST